MQWLGEMTNVAIPNWLFLIFGAASFCYVLERITAFIVLVLSSVIEVLEKRRA